MCLNFVNLWKIIFIIARFMHVLYQKWSKGEITFEKHETSSNGLEAKSEKIFQFCRDQSKVKNKPGSKSVYNTTQTRNLETFEVYTLQQSFKLVKLYNQKFYLKVLLLIILKYLTHGIFFLCDTDQIYVF